MIGAAGYSIRRHVVAAAILAALLASCAGERGKPTRASPSPTTRPAASPDGKAAGAGSTTRAITPLPSPSRIRVKGSPLEPSAIRPTEPGRYTFDESGVKKVKGCFTREEPPPTPTTLVVDPTHGNRQQSIRDQRYPDGRGVLTTRVFEFRGDGVYLAFLRQSQTSPLGTTSTEFEPSPLPLVLPAMPAAGQRWSSTFPSKDGKVTVTTESTVEAVEESVLLGNGNPSPAVRLKGSAHITGESELGPLDIIEDSTTWVSLRARLVVREVIDSRGRAGLCELESHVESLLRSITPA